MNRQQVLNQLRIMQAWHEDNGDGPNADYDAICFAIEAIERSEDLEKLITALEQEHAKLREMQSATDINVGITDTISRQAAIDIAKELIITINGYEQHNQAVNNYSAKIMQLPPAQPEPCEDAVSKETILKFLDGWMSVLDENCHNQSVSDLKIIKRDFENLPPVTPKQRTGKWLWQTGKIKCNQCLRAIRRIDHDGLLNFCPNCGANMEGDAE